MNWKNTSVLILSKDQEFSNSLKDYLQNQHLSDELFIGSYADVDRCIEHLNNDDKEDVVVLKYDKELAEELSRKTNELLQNITLIHCVSDEGDQNQVRFVKSGAKEYAVTGKKPFRRIDKLIRNVVKGNSAVNVFANVNYWVALFIMITLIFALIYFFV